MPIISNKELDHSKFIKSFVGSYFYDSLIYIFIFIFLCFFLFITEIDEAFSLKGILALNIITFFLVIFLRIVRTTFAQKIYHTKYEFLDRSVVITDIRDNKTKLIPYSEIVGFDFNFDELYLGLHYGKMPFSRITVSPKMKPELLLRVIDHLILKVPDLKKKITIPKLPPRNFRKAIVFEGEYRKLKQKVADLEIS